MTNVLKECQQSTGKSCGAACLATALSEMNAPNNPKDPAAIEPSIYTMIRDTGTLLSFPFDIYHFGLGKRGTVTTGSGWFQQAITANQLDINTPGTGAAVNYLNSLLSERSPLWGINIQDVFKSASYYTKDDWIKQIAPKNGDNSLRAMKLLKKNTDTLFTLSQVTPEQAAITQNTNLTNTNWIMSSVAFWSANANQFFGHWLLFREKNAKIQVLNPDGGKNQEIQRDNFDGFHNPRAVPNVDTYDIAKIKSELLAPTGSTPDWLFTDKLHAHVSDGLGHQVPLRYMYLGVSIQFTK